MPNTGPLVAIVDDDHSVRMAIGGLMRSIDFQAEVFASAEEFLGFPSLEQVGCLIVDLNMPNVDGLALHQALLLQGRPIPTIVITAHPSDHLRARALQAGVVCFLAKPFDEDDLLIAVRDALASGGHTAH